MIRNPHILEAFERELARRRRPDFQKNLRIFEGLYEEARALGKWTAPAIRSESSWKVEFARRLNVRRTSGEARPGP